MGKLNHCQDHPPPTSYCGTFHLVIIYSKLNRKIIRATMPDNDMWRGGDGENRLRDGVEYYSSISYCMRMIKYPTAAPVT